MVKHYEYKKTHKIIRKYTMGNLWKFSGDHYGYVFRMFVNRTEVCDDFVSVHCACTQLLRYNLFFFL